MKLRSKRSALHARAELIIPWLANESLPADAEPALREHIATCPDCRQDYEEQLRVRRAMRAEGPLVFAAESSYQKLLTRIRTSAVMDEEDETQDGEEGMRAPLGTRPLTGAFRHPSPLVRGLAAAVILQTFAIGFGAWVWHSQGLAGQARYVTLTSPSPSYPSYESGPRVRVVFRADLSVGALQGMLQELGARIINGPEDGDVYTLGFTPPLHSGAPLEKRVAALRANPDVLFAEPVQDGVH